MRSPPTRTARSRRARPRSSAARSRRSSGRASRAAGRTSRRRAGGAVGRTSYVEVDMSNSTCQPLHMSLPHAVLGLLTLAPSNGYELTRRFDESLSNAWSASHSQIYPELAKLEQAGLVEVVGEGARGSRTYAATA